MLRVPQRLHCSPIYDDVVSPGMGLWDQVVVSPGMIGFHIESRDFWDILDRNSCVLHIQAEWESQCYAIDQEFMRENTPYQAYYQVKSHQEHVFALVRRWIYSNNLGIGLHGICDGNAKEGGLAPETDKQGERIISNMPLETPWLFRVQVLSSFILCLQLSNTCNNEGCDKSRHHKCANCKFAFYCCKECQVKDCSARHKRVCKCIANAFATDQTTLTADLRAW